jgi:hypothetical protein
VSQHTVFACHLHEREPFLRFRNVEHVSDEREAAGTGAQRLAAAGDVGTDCEIEYHGDNGEGSVLRGRKTMSTSSPVGARRGRVLNSSQLFQGEAAARRHLPFRTPATSVNHWGTRKVVPH